MERIRFERTQGVPSAGSVPASVDQIRKDILKLEQQVDEKLAAYGSFSEVLEKNMIDRDNDLEVDLTSEQQGAELESLLGKLSSSVKQLSLSNVSTGILQQHKMHLDDYTKDFRRLKSKVSQQISRLQLLQGGRSGTRGTTDTTVEMDLLMRERQGIGQSSTMATDLLRGLLETKDSLDSQHATLARNNSRLSGVNARFGDIQSLMSAIRNKKWKNTIIMGLFIAFLTCSLLWYWLSGRGS